MRRFLALARSAALEALAEPFSAVLLLVALVTIHLVPVFHCHQFGEAARLPRECGFSALLVFGLVFATSAAVRAIGRELESGTAAAALSRPVSRPLFFCAKIIGVFVAFLLFAAAVVVATVLSVLSAETGAALAREEGLSRVWGPGVAAGVGFTLLGFAGAALRNRFRRARFAVSACVLLAGLQPPALLSVMFLPGAVAVDGRVCTPFLVLAVGCSVFVALAGAGAVGLKPAAVTAVVSVAVLLSFVCPVRFLLPDINQFWLVDRLAAHATLSAGDVLAPLAAGGLLVAFWLTVGSLLLQRREIP